MSLTALLDRITNRQKERDQRRRTGYHEMVRRIAEGNEPDIEEVDRVLRDSGKMLSELRRHVEIMSQRLKWRAELDRVPVHVAERERIEKQIQAADKVLEAAEKKHTDITMPLVAGLANVKRALRECDEAQRKLQDTCLDEALLEELHEVAITQATKIINHG